MRMQQAINRDIKHRRQLLASISEKRVLQSPKYYIEDRRIQLDRSTERIMSAMQGQIYKKRERYSRLAASLDAMSPLKVLGRGYAIAKRIDGKVIKTAGDVKAGDRLVIRLKKDEITCIAE
jgi:exodeoxyribonuclease VII large subunit